VDGKGLMLGLLVISVALWGLFMLSVTSGGPEDAGGECLSQENC